MLKVLYSGSVTYLDEKNNVFVAPSSSCTYIETSENKIIVDTSSKDKKKIIISNLNKLDVKLKEIDYIISSHNHNNHNGNNGLFRNAKIVKYSDGSINDFKDPEVEIIWTPGHTFDSISVIHEDYVVAPAAVHLKKIFYKIMIFPLQSILKFQKNQSKE
ncbi:MBL fold metallo-hydrolase [Methanococcus maripaludis]|uniref:Metallo-beta-lactamase domain-containing protein 1 n=3 Tax=Methanococcus maripaludis TaxID=39152 RepID=A0A2Z5PV76_METMI|nr:beta-lactamase-like protein [Methanococcus maripaludis X1]BAP60777.1 beta-lactamase like-protein [Methanococcus maripaludis KA1]BAP62741.1 beta-lactamase like-protein [Methanococcus maripaludis OS7]